MERIVGIDLGTSTSCIAVIDHGEPIVVPDSRGNRITPSYIHIMEDGRILVGPQAKAEVISDPYSTIWATKRLIGRRFKDPEVQEAIERFGYTIYEGEDGGVLVKGRDKELSPTEVGAIILKYLTRLTRKALGEDVKKAIITVPAYFTDPQRKATREAGTMIGLDVVKLVNEPTAAALAYGYDMDAEQNVAMFDLGGGTFDLSLLSIGQGVFEVIATDGDSYLGGEDFDNRLVDYVVEDFKKKFKIDIKNDKMAHQRVKDAAERAKIALSDKTEVEINLPAICPDVNRWAGVELTVSQKIYEGLVADLVGKTVDIFQRVLKEVGMTPGDLDNVIMVGGMTRMPLVKQRVAEFINSEPDCSMNPDESVAVGAAIHAAGLSGEKLLKRNKAARLAPPRKPEVSRPKVTADQDMTRPGMPGEAVIPGPDATLPGIPSPETMDIMDEGPTMPSFQPDSSTLDTFFGASVEKPVGQDQEIEKVLFHDEEPVPMDEAEDNEETGFTSLNGKSVAPDGALPDKEPIDMEPDEEVEEEGAGLRSDADLPSAGAAPSAEYYSPPYARDEDHASPGMDLPGETMTAGSEMVRPVDGEDLLPADPSTLIVPEEEDLRPADPMAGRDFAVLTDSMELPLPPAGVDEHPVSAGPLIPEAPAEKPISDEQPAEEFVSAPVLLDVLSQTVGIAHFGGHFSPIIRRFAKLPARATQVFTTCVDNQRRIRVTVLQGEGKYIKENTPLGEFLLEGIESARRGVPEIEVTFDIDQSGIFIISARDVKSGAAKEIRLENWTGANAPGPDLAAPA